MSCDIHYKAIYSGVEIKFKMPPIDKTVDLDFNGFVKIEAINNNGKMQLTGNAINGHGIPISIPFGSVKFIEG